MKTTFREKYEQMGNTVLAVKGNVYLVKYKCGDYAVDKNTKGCSCTLKMGNETEIVEFFKETIKHVRGSKNNYNLEVYM